MSTAATTKTERVEVRMEQWQKALIQRAARLSGVNVTDYILMHTLSVAKDDVQKTNELVLSVEAATALSTMIRSPQKPTQELIELMKFTRELEKKFNIINDVTNPAKR